MENNWFERFVEKQFHSIHQKLEKILANQADVDAALAELKATDATLTDAVTAYSTLVAKVNADLAALEAKLAAGGTVDLAAEVAAIKAESTANAAQVAAIVAGNASLTSADATANPAPAPAPAPSTPAPTATPA